MYQPPGKVNCLNQENSNKGSKGLIPQSSSEATSTDRARWELTSAAARCLSWITWSFSKLVVKRFQAAWRLERRAFCTFDCAATTKSSVSFPLASWTNAILLKSKSGSRPFLAENPKGKKRWLLSLTLNICFSKSFKTIFLMHQNSK